MDLIGLLIALVLGGISGWLAGKIMGSDGTVLRNIILGIVGGVVGSVVLGLFGLGGSGYIGTIVVSVIGACILIWLVRLITKK